MELDHKRSSKVFYKIGNRYYLKSKFKQAIWFYDHAISHDASNCEAFHNRGLAKCCLEPPDYDGAIEDLRKTVELQFCRRSLPSRSCS